MMANATGRYTTVYDALRRRRSVTTPAGHVLTYSYDSLDRRTQLNTPAGVFTYSYDNDNRLTRLVNPHSDRTSISWDDASRRTVTRLANGTRASFTYDAANHTTRLANIKSTGATISSFGYEYDRAGNRTEIAEADGSRVTYSYDATYRLTSEHRTGTTPYRNTNTYDPTANRLLKNESGSRTTYSYDNANQLTTSIDSSGTTTYSFDNDGNQELTITPTGDRTTTTWDFENKTTLLLLPTGTRNTMLYDPDGLRVRLDDSSGTKKTTFDGQAYLLDTDAADTVQAVFTQEPSLYGGLISQRRGTTTNWYHFDALGSTRELTDSSQLVTDTYLYDAWGTILSATGTTTNPFRYVGQLGYYFDPDTGKFYIRARIYDPLTARWTSVDPLLFADSPILRSVYLTRYRQVQLLQRTDGLRLRLAAVDEIMLPGGNGNTYAYVDNSPSKWVDPWGLQRECPSGKESRPRPGYKPPPPNGCTLSPDCPIFGANFRGPCDVHDNCYAECNRPKDECDRNFLVGMIHACIQADAGLQGWRCRGGWWGLARCIAVARAYAEAVHSDTGLVFYREAQEDACECVAKC